MTIKDRLWRYTPTCMKKFIRAADIQFSPRVHRHIWRLKERDYGAMEFRYKCVTCEEWKTERMSVEEAGPAIQDRHLKNSLQSFRDCTDREHGIWFEYSMDGGKTWTEIE